MRRRPPASEQYFRVPDVAKRLGISEQTVTRIFENRPATKILGRREGDRQKRRYRIILIAESDLNNYLTESAA